jgi:hypothetical protein
MTWNLLFTNKEMMICYERIERAFFFSLSFLYVLQKHALGAYLAG